MFTDTNFVSFIILLSSSFPVFATKTNSPKQTKLLLKAEQVPESKGEKHPETGQKAGFLRCSCPAAHSWFLCGAPAGGGALYPLSAAAQISGGFTEGGLSCSRTVLGYFGLADQVSHCFTEHVENAVS